VLLVDESPAIRHALRRLLEDEGMRVVGEAASAKDAIAAVMAIRPEVVLTDLRLDGLALTAAVVGVAPGTGVVICTALAGSSLDEHARTVGASAVVAKGSHPAVLVRAIEQAARDVPREGAMPRPA
jgi:DNA-binding NarL/FixJ family response regulator